MVLRVRVLRDFAGWCLSPGCGSIPDQSDLASGLAPVADQDDPAPDQSQAESDEYPPCPHQDSPQLMVGGYARGVVTTGEVLVRMGTCAK